MPMRIALVTCFNANWHHGRIPSPYIPLNLLGLSATLQNEGHEVVVIDQTLALLQGKVDDGPAFHDQIGALIHEQRPDIIGLTTMCNSYPQTLALARHYRKHDPHARIILGGPQATVVDTQTLRAFPWIDAVVRGEADYSLAELAHTWERGDAPEQVAGITWRDHHGEVRRNPNAPLLSDMDALPYPAYDLYPLGDVNEHLIPIEAGRGCPYGCTFCSTNLYFNRRYRIKSPERLIAEMLHMRERYGVSGFDLVHDMLTVDRKWVQAFCDQLIDGEYGFRWGCSARVDRVDEALLRSMSAAGCLGMFFGVETGSQRLQPIVKKRLMVDQVLPCMRTCTELRISATGSMITGFPDETIDDLLDSFNLALDILQVSPHTRAQMHMLAPLVGSPLYEQYKDDLHFDGHSSDISLFLLSGDEIDMVERYPDIFPNFYYIPTPHLERDLVKATSAAVYTCADLFLVLRCAGADLRRVLEGWVPWQRSHVGAEADHQDYYLYHFGSDFCRYLQDKIVAPLIPQAPYIADMVRYFRVRYGFQRNHISARTLFEQFNYDVQNFVRSLRGEKRSDAPTTRPTDLLFVRFNVAPQYGTAYLEIQVPRTQQPLVNPGDVLEIRDLEQQVLRRPEIIIRNNTQRRAFAAKHHLSQEHIDALRLQVA
jgi:radical SAM superfamily enzyme YgiQ (UPF0313 family)